MIIWILGFLASFGNNCCGNCTEEEMMTYDCDHQWVGEEYDWNGDGSVTVVDLMNYLYYYNG